MSRHKRSPARPQARPPAKAAKNALCAPSDATGGPTPATEPPRPTRGNVVGGVAGNAEPPTPGFGGSTQDERFQETIDEAIDEIAERVTRCRTCVQNVRRQGFTSRQTANIISVSVERDLIRIEELVAQIKWQSESQLTAEA